MTYAELNAMREVDVKEQEISNLVEIETVQIDSSQPPAERLKSFIDHVGNPYCFLVGGTPVKISFSD